MPGSLCLSDRDDYAGALGFSQAGAASRRRRTHPGILPPAPRRPDADVRRAGTGPGPHRVRNLARNPRSYVGRRDPQRGQPGPTRSRRAAATSGSPTRPIPDYPDASADVVIGEAMPPWQRVKHTIVAEAARGAEVPVARYAIHELAGAGRSQSRSSVAVAGLRYQGQCASADRCGMVAPRSGPWTGRRTRCHRFHGAVTTATGDEGASWVR